jgi:predicted ATPase/DNA-binding CsgD family transcriptional regulator
MWTAAFTLVGVRSIATRRAGNLPAEISSFVGRRQDVSAVRGLLAGARLVTLTGPGGVGKSRLALHVAALARRSFADGVWLVDLAPLHDPQLVARTVIDTLGIRESADSPAHDVLADYLADKSLLLVLDNCEHLLEACARLAATILRAAPEVRLLATSRETLRVEGEHVFPVSPLAVPGFPGRATVEQLLACDAVALFADRAAAVAPEFHLDARTVEPVAGLVRRLDGIPLAIELAAARLSTLSVEELRDRVDKALWQVTAGGRRSGLERQRTLRATIDWSFSLCTPAEQALWARLSVFAGGFDLAAAEAVCTGEGIDPEGVLDLLTDLIDKNVLLRHHYDSQFRFRLLDTIRQYGQERLADSGGQTTLRRRHRDWYHHLAASAQAEWNTSRQLEWFTRLHEEHANLRVTLEFCLEVPGEARSGLEMACALRTYWHASGTVAEGRRWMDRLLATDRESTPTRGEALRVAAYLALFHNDVDAGRPLAEQAFALAEEFGDLSGIAWATHVLGFATFFTGDVDNAIELFERALAAFRALEDTGGILLTLFYLSSALAVTDPERAAPLAGEAVALSESVGEHWMRSWALWTLGVIAWRGGDTRRAADCEREAIRHKQFFDHRFGIGQCIEVLAWAAATEGQHQRAIRLLGGLTGVWREAHASLYRHLRPFHDQVQADLRAELGEQGFNAAFDAGTRLGYEQLVYDALGHRRSERPSTRSEPSLLTRREAEIAELVTQGMSNKQIAATLVISPRTADTHVENILIKLGFTSRTQIARWVTEQHRPGPADTSPGTGDTAVGDR